MKPADFHKQHHQTIKSHPTLNAAHAANGGKHSRCPQHSCCPQHSRCPQQRRDGLSALLEEPRGRSNPELTQFRDAPDARGQQGLLQGPEFQLGVGVGPSVAAHRAVVVGAEVGWEGQHTWGRAHSRPLRNEPTHVEKQIPPGGMQNSHLSPGISEQFKGNQTAL